MSTWNLFFALRKQSDALSPMTRSNKALTCTVRRVWIISYIGFPIEFRAASFSQSEDPMEGCSPSHVQNRPFSCRQSKRLLLPTQLMPPTEAGPRSYPLHTALSSRNSAPILTKLPLHGTHYRHGANLSTNIYLTGYREHLTRTPPRSCTIFCEAPGALRRTRCLTEPSLSSQTPRQDFRVSSTLRAKCCPTKHVIRVLPLN